MAEEDDITTLSGAEEENLSGGQGGGAWERKRSELEAMAAQYDAMVRQRAQSPYADNTGGRLGQALWAKQALAESPPPRYSAVYDEDAGKGEPDYPNAPIVQGPPEPDYAAAPKQGAEYPFQPPMSQADVREAATPAAVAEAPPPIRTFAGNVETTPQGQGMGSAYQSLGPEGQKKYRYLMQHRQDILRGTYGPHQSAALTDVSRQVAELIHVHEEGEARGAAKALATIGGQQAQQMQQAQQKPIFSDRQKQLIGQLQASEQEFKMMANRGEIGEDEIRKGVEYYQQAYASIKPIGNAGLPFDPRFKPDQQPGMDWIDQKTGKHMARDEKGNVQDMQNERTLSTLGQLPAHESHKLVSETAAMYGETDEQAIARLTAREMAIRGQPIPPELKASLSQNVAHKGPDAKTPHEEMTLSQKEWMDERHKVASRIDARLQHKDASGNVHGDIKPEQREQAVHQEMVSMGLATHDPDSLEPDTYKRYREHQTKALTGAAPAAASKAPEAIGAPAESPAPVQDFASKQIPEAIQKAANKIPFAEVPLNRLRELMQTYPNISAMSPEEKGEYVEGMQVMHQIDPRYPEMTPAYIKKIGAIMPAKPYHQREFSKALNEV